MGSGEKKTVGWGVEPERRPVCRVEGMAKIVRTPAAVADQFQAADHRANLMMEERAGGGVNRNSVAASNDIKAIECLHRARGLTVH